MNRINSKRKEKDIQITSLMEVNTIHLLLSKFQSVIDDFLSNSSLQPEEKQVCILILIF